MPVSTEYIRYLESRLRERDTQAFELDPKGKPKRKVSAYAKRYGTAFKKLKRKHPRMTFGSLSKKAHRVARK